MMPVEEVSFTPERQDVYRVQAIQMARQEALAQGNFYGFALLILAFAIPVSAYVVASIVGFEPEFRDDAALAITVGCGCGLLLHHFITRQVQRTATKLVAEATPWLFAPQRLALYPKTLELTADGIVTASIDLAAIDDAEIDGEHILIWQGPNLITYAPLNAFPSPRDADDFAAAIVTRARMVRRGSD